MVLEELDFDGTRKQGQNDISLVKKFETGFNIPFNQNASGTGITFNIPQGTYTEIRISLRVKDFNNAPSIILNGYYVNTIGNTLPVYFEYENNEHIEIAAKTSSGNTEIVLIEDKPSNAAIILNPHYWFGPVTQNMLETADTTIINSVPNIIITKDDNEDIYDLIINRIRDGNEVIFN